MKAQIGTRVDRILYTQFLDLCRREKLRQGEAFDALMRAALNAGSIRVVASDQRGIDSKTRRLKTAVFKLKLEALREDVESNHRLRKDAIRYELSDNLLSEMVELASAIDDETLLSEFEKILDGDKASRPLYLKAKERKERREARERRALFSDDEEDGSGNHESRI